MLTTNETRPAKIEHLFPHPAHWKGIVREKWALPSISKRFGKITEHKIDHERMTVSAKEPLKTIITTIRRSLDHPQYTRDAILLAPLGEKLIDLIGMTASHMAQTPLVSETPEFRFEGMPTRLLSMTKSQATRPLLGSISFPRSMDEQLAMIAILASSLVHASLIYIHWLHEAAQNDGSKHDAIFSRDRMIRFLNNVEDGPGPRLNPRILWADEDRNYHQLATIQTPSHRRITTMILDHIFGHIIHADMPTPKAKDNATHA